MSIFSGLYKKEEKKEFNFDSELKEAFRLGESSVNKEKEKSIQLYKNIVKKSPSTLVAWFNMGVMQNRIGNWREAVSSFRKAEMDPELRLIAGFAKLKLKLDNGESTTDGDFPPEYRGDKRATFGVIGPCANAANELRNRGYSCRLDIEDESCSIHCGIDNNHYIITVSDMLGMLIKNVWRKDGEDTIHLGGIKSLSDVDKGVSTLDVGRLPFSQAPVSISPDVNQYRIAKKVSGRTVGHHGWVKEGRSFGDVSAQQSEEAKRSGIRYFNIISIETIAGSNCSEGTFFTCNLEGEPHVIAMPMILESENLETINSTIKACILKARYFEEVEYPLVHLGLGIPVRFVDRSKVEVTITECLANFAEANFQEWIETIENKSYTIVNVAKHDGTIVANGKVKLDAELISEIVDCVNKANAFLKTIPEGSQNFKIAAEKFFLEYPEPFI
jgi:hypothetical protein